MLLADALGPDDFAAEGDRFVLTNELRRSVIFGRHELIQDAPISRMTLIVWRNTLMSFNAEIQARILARFHFALADHPEIFSVAFGAAPLAQIVVDAEGAVARSSCGRSFRTRSSSAVPSS
jgi:CheR methyltransferase-like protein